MLLDLWFPFTPRVAWSPVVYDRSGRMLAAYLSTDDKWRLRGGLAEYDSRFVDAIVFKEDRWFRWHVGVNPVAVGRALVHNALSGRRTSGASTITMQVARLLDPAPRTYSSKLREMFRALQLEWHLSKNEILELYLNLLPYGGNIEGLKTASLMYLAASPDALSLGQLTALAVVPNRPGSLRLGAYPERLLTARNRWLDAMTDARLFPASQIVSARDEPVVFQRRSLPNKARHFCRRLLHQKPLDENALRSTLDESLQERAEMRLRQHVRSWRLRGVSQAAAVVVHNATGEIRAWVGSADFDEAAYGGQVDGVLALRSPGSALKPFLYALAYDKGLCLPETRVADVPIDLRGYAPENYDEKFRGWITTADALALSLNIPAVRLLNETGVDSLVDLLRKGGCSASKERKLGLSMILGGCEVSLLELTALYVALARQGEAKGLKSMTDEVVASDARLFSAGAAWMTTEVLAKIRRPDLPADWQSTSRLPRVAWKTGTSYGRRDAWAVGFNPEYTVGVWVGNFDGSGNPTLSGADAATPLLFSLFGLLPPAQQWFKRQQDLAPLQVCAHSGLPPGEYCGETRSAFGLKRRLPARRCDHREWVWTSNDGRTSFCTACLPADGFTRTLFDRWSPEMVEYFRTEKIPYDQPPPHYAACPRLTTGGGLEITSPTPDAELFYEKGRRARLSLTARTDNRESRLHWFVNGRYLQAAYADEPLFYEADSGLHVIVCRDEQGRSRRSRVRVVRY